MSGSVGVGRIGGVPVRVHWSVVVIAGLLAWSLAAQVFPQSYPDASDGATWIAGSIAAVVFLLGLLAHELSHAVVARRHGVRVEDITLWALGGIARLRDEAPDARADLRIAGAGPLASVLLGLLFGAAAWLLDAVGIDGLPVGALVWLAWINLLLAAFNILPGAPLDGGRLLRAALWTWRGDRLWATVTAARAGRALGLLLVGLGVAQLVVLGSAAGLWLALIGWFILGSATAEGQQAKLADSLTGVLVRDVMTPDPETVPAGLAVGEFVEHHLLVRRHTTFPVLDLVGRPSGLVTAARIKALPRSAWDLTPLAAVAWPMDEVPVAAPEEPLADLLPRLGGPTGGRALVLDGGRLVGIVSPLDVTRALERSTSSRPVALPAPRRAADGLATRGPGRTP